MILKRSRFVFSSNLTRAQHVLIYTKQGMSSVYCVVHCGQTVQDRPIAYKEVEQECGDDISIGTIFDPLSSP